MSEPGANDTVILDPVVYLGRKVGLPLATRGRACEVPERDGEEVILGVGEIGLVFGDAIGWVVERVMGLRRGGSDGASIVGEEVNTIGVR